MAGNCGEMTIVGFFNLILFYFILNGILKTVTATDGHGQAFIQTDNELRYLIDGVSIHLHENLMNGASSVSLTDVDDDNLHTYASPIRFQPAELDFKEHPVGVPLIEQVVVINPSGDTRIHMLSISGSTTEFHCSFFVDKTIPPGGNTTFDVVFLGRQEGIVENTLFIHTSLGSFKYQVKAKGIPNPYRLRPFLNVKMPLNSSYSPVIHMHNPYRSTLQVTEMYSSAGDLHLELPSGEIEASHDAWEIPPFETKPVMKANFIGRVENNHTAYIRIKTNSSNNDNLILPVEVEVSSLHGIYSLTEVLDFGVLRSEDKVKTLSLNLINYGQKHVQIQNVIVAPANEAVSVVFQPIKVPPDNLHPTQVAAISFNPKKVSQMKQHSGKIVVKSKNTQFKLTIPYQVTMLQGSLKYDRSITKFYLGEKALSSRNLSVTNLFNISVIIHNVALLDDVQSAFKIHHFKQVILAPGETVTVMELDIQKDEAVSGTSFLRLFTNISFFDIPIVCYDGKLKKIIVPSLNKDQIEFGSLSVGEERELFIVFANENPVDVDMIAWTSNFTMSTVDLVGVDEGNVTEAAAKLNFINLSNSTTIQPNYYIVFRMTVTAPDIQGIYYGELAFTTSFETIKVPFYFWSVTGNLNADLILFDNAFPGKISWKTLQIHSTFSQPMTVTSVEAFPHDSRFSFEPFKTESSILKPETKSTVGKLYFDPMKECSPNCYAGMPVNTPMGQKWLVGMNIPPAISETDTELHRTMKNRWKEFFELGQHSLNVTFKLNTNEVRGFSLNARVKFQWPSIVNKNKIKFPFTQIGNETVREFYLENPSTLPVIAQVLMLPMYSNPQKILDSLQLKLFDNASSGNIVFDDKDTFTLQDTEQYNTREDNPIPTYRRSIEEYFRVQPLQSSIALLLTPGMRVRIRVGFAPKNELVQSSVVLIRNNLTVIDTVIVQGQGGYGQFKFGNKKPGTSSPLFFEMTEKHLKDCGRVITNKSLPPNFTVRRTFIARNTGELPLYIKNFAINDSPCEGYGFKVMGCKGFELMPNASKKIDIAFTPDFTMTKIQRTLNIFTSLTPTGLILNYSLIATIPPHLMIQCASALPRPEWEPLLYYSSYTLMVFLFFCILVAAYFESERIFKYRFISMTTSVVPNSENVYEKSKVFDLKNMVFRDAEFRSACAFGDANNVSVNEKRPKSTSSVSSNSSSVCSNLLNISPGLFKRKKANNNNNWAHSSKQLFDRALLREKDACNNNIGKSYNFESENVTCKVQNNNKKTGKRSSTIMNDNSSPAACRHEKSSCDNRRTWSSCNGSASQVELNEKEKEKSVNNNNNSNNSENKAKVKSNVRSRTPTKCETNSDNKSNVSRHKSLDLTEDSSSTTTESSAAELDLIEKHSDNSSSVKSSKSKNSRMKAKTPDTHIEKNVKKVDSIENNNNDDEGDFELSTKNKSHRKVKVDHSKSFGGDILRPNTLELPYKLKSPSEEKTPKHTNGKIKKILVNKTKGPLHVLASESNIKGRTTHLNDWDQPKQISNSDEAFSELAKQTEMFAQKIRRSSSDRPTSYSEIVSDGLPKHQNLVSSKTTPALSTSIITPELERKEFKHPGTIGQRLPQSQNKSVSPVGNNSWGSTMLSPATPHTPVPPSSLFFPSDLLQDSDPQSRSQECVNKEITSEDGYSVFNGNRSSYLNSLWDPESNWQSNPGSQRDGEDWGNFGMNLLGTDGVWNTNYNLDSNLDSNAWSSKDLFGYSSMGNKNGTDDNSMYESPLFWSSWANSSANTGESTSEIASGFDATSTQVSKEPEKKSDIKETCPDFDPFRTPHDIWSPSHPLTNSKENDSNQSWAFSLFSNKSSSN